MWWIGRRGIRVMVNMRLWYLRLIKKIFFATATFHLTTTTHLTAIVSTTSNKSKSVMEGLSFPIRKFLCSFAVNSQIPRDMSVSEFRTISSALLGSIWDIMARGGVLMSLLLKLRITTRYVCSGVSNIQLSVCRSSLISNIMARDRALKTGSCRIFIVQIHLED